MEPTTPEEVLRYCTENPDQLSTEQLLAKFPAFRGELERLLSMHNNLSNALPQAMPAASKQLIKQRLLAAASAQQAQQAQAQAQAAGTAAQRVPAEAAVFASAEGVSKDVAIGAQRRAALRGFNPLRRSAWPLAGILAALILLLWYSAARALPDNPLYGLRLASENASILLASDSVAVAKAHLNVANQRLFDIRTMQASGKLAQAGTGFRNYRDHMEIGTGIWRGSTGRSDNTLTKIVYLSGLAGTTTFEDLGGAVESLPSALKDEIGETLGEVASVEVSAGDALKAQGLDLARISQESLGSQFDITALLTPVPGSTPLPTPSTAAQCLDTYENDGVPSQAKKIELGETQRHLFCPAADADWLMFFATPGQGYGIEAAPLSQEAPGANPFIYLFAQDTVTVLDHKGDAPGSSGPARLDFYPKTAGWYFVQVKDRGDIGGPGIAYTVTLSALPASLGTAVATPAASPTLAP